MRDFIKNILTFIKNINTIVIMKETDLKNGKLESDTYETPKSNVINLQTETAILGGSVVTGSSQHEGFYEEDYQW